MTDKLTEDLIENRADWLVDAVATATQNRMFLRGDPECDDVACVAIQMNGEKAMQQVTAPLQARILANEQASFEAVKREARNEALKEALAKIESHIEMVSSGSPTRFALDWVRDDILALMEDTDDE